jgi:hypothetical protein
MANISAIAKTPHVITTLEAAQGYAVIHISWPSPFFDTNYSIAWGVEDSTPGIGPSLNFSVGDKHNVTANGFDATVYLLAVPVVQKTVNLIGIDTTQDIVFNVLNTSAYNVTLYYQSLGTGDNSTLIPAIMWTDPQGNAQELTYPYLGTVTGDGSGGGLLQNYALPFLCKAGTTCTCCGRLSRLLHHKIIVTNSKVFTKNRVVWVQAGKYRHAFLYVKVADSRTNLGAADVLEFQNQSCHKGTSLLNTL